ncbi:protein SDA1 homolog [Ctenocephalides felis]|uniref:protein SDA1 homolog n=1 Tax=Ctenocephalides felis TaxID=7515 RepID=UPI000E6E215E|nr:protein SDA1 homolog [Ctenocephalides felis]
MVRHNNQLPNNLPQLQNLIKRDSESYKEEFIQQYKHFQSLIDIFRLTPTENDKNLDELVMFLAQVSSCFPSELQDFPQTLIDLLKSHGPVLDPTTRMTLCKALILLRNKKLLPALVLLELFFTLLRCSDKALRTFLQTHIVTDIKNMNAKHKDAKVNSSLQGFMYSMLKDNNTRAAKMSIDIMIDLYKKNVWNDIKTVNVIANNGCFSKLVKVRVAALKFFLGSDPNEKDSDESDSDEPNAKEVMMANKVNKKSRKREKQLTKVKKAVAKNKKKKSNAPVFNYSALQLVHNPQGLAEGLYKQLEAANERFEVKLMTLDVISRLIGLHELFLFNIYPYMQRYLQPHQREVTRILQFTAQASHDLLPPETLHSVLRAIVNNFVTERNSSDVIAIGLNAIREICSRCPLAMEEDLLRDLAQFKTYRDRSVMMAAKSLIHLYREAYPELLHRKDRGRPTEHQASIVPLKYGEIRAPDYVPGAEVLIKKLGNEDKEDEVDEKSAVDSDDSDWVDLDENSGSELHISDSELEEESADEAETSKDDEKNDQDATEPKINEVEAAQLLSMERIFTDADYRKMEIAQAKAKVLPASRKRPAEELVSLADIENIHKKRKHDKASRLETVKEGQKDREKFGYKDGRMNIHCSKTNREKRKKKNFQMIKHKIRGKIKRSFQDKQKALRKHLIQQKKMK